MDVEKYAPSGNISKWEFGKCGFSQASGTVSRCRLEYFPLNPSPIVSFICLFFLYCLFDLVYKAIWNPIF
jgi:hypothetical protein